jgi:hypothetical protein
MPPSRASSVAAVLAVLAAGLLLVPAAAAHELLEERAESAVERYALSVQGGSTGFLHANLPDGEGNLDVVRYDAGPCRRRSAHQRVCPVVYEGKDYTEEDCRDASIVSDPLNDTSECFRNVACRQTVLVTLPGSHVGPSTGRERTLVLRASQLRCDYEAENAPTAKRSGG